MKMCSTPQHARVRRIVAAESTQILANHRAYVPIKLLLDDLNDVPCDWVSDVAVTKDAALLPRALLSHNVNACLPITNVSDKHVLIRRGEVITQAYPRLPLCDTVPPGTLRLFTPRLVHDVQTHQKDMAGSDVPINRAKLNRVVTADPIVHSADATNATVDLSIVDALSAEQRTMIDEMLLSVDESLSAHDCDSLRVVLARHIGAFAKHRHDVGCASEFEHTVPLASDHPPVITCKARYYGPAIQKVIDEQVKAWLENGIVEPSTTEYSSPLVVVAKRVAPGQTQEWRTCVDLKRVNECFLRSQFPLNNLHQTIHHLADARYVCKLDLTQSFFSIPIEKNSRKFFAFKVKGRLLEYCRLHFGYRNSAQALCSLLSRLLQSIDDPMIHSYVDDVFICSETVSTGLSSLSRLLSAFERYGVRVNHRKCSFFVRRFEALGWVFCDGMLDISAERRNAILRTRFPTTVRAIRALTGSLQYIADSVENLAIYLSPFTDALRKNAPPWEDNQVNRAAFERLIQTCSIFGAEKYF